MGISKKGSNEGCRWKNGRFARRVKAAPKAFIFLLAEAQQGVVIEHAFTALPQLVLTVDKSSLEQLLSLDSVLNVTLDEVAYPQ